MLRRFCLFIGLAMSASALQASPCGHAIDKVQAEVDARIGVIAKTSPGVRESRAALLNHQPTPASIAAAERGLKGHAEVERALAALRRARRADAHGNRVSCERALDEARADIGLH